MNSATNRKGEIFLIDEECNVNGYHPKMDGRILIITGFKQIDNCESGVMVSLKDKETQNPVKRSLDTNWLIKIKN